MAFDLGTVFATIGLSTEPLESGASAVGGIVDGIVGNLERIGDVALGVVIGEQVDEAIAALERLPQALVKVQTDLESFNAGLTALYRSTAEQTIQSQDDIAQAVEAGTQKQRTALERANQDMTNAQNNFVRDTESSNQRLVEIHEEAGRQIADAVKHHNDALEDSATGAQRAYEDLADKVNSAMQRMQDSQSNSTANFDDSIDRYADHFAQTMSQIGQGFERTMANLNFSHQETMTRLGQQAEAAMAQYDDQMATAQSDAANSLAQAAQKHTDTISKLQREASVELDNFAEKHKERLEKMANAVGDAVASTTLQLAQVEINLRELETKSKETSQKITEDLYHSLSDLQAKEVAEAEKYAVKLEKIAADGYTAIQKNADNAAAIMDVQRSREEALANSMAQTQAQMESAASSAADRIQSLRDSEAEAEDRDQVRLEELHNRLNQATTGKERSGIQAEITAANEETKIREDAEKRAEARENERLAKQQEQIQKQAAQAQKQIEDEYSKREADAIKKYQLEVHSAEQKQALDRQTAELEHVANLKSIDDAKEKANKQAAAQLKAAKEQEDAQRRQLEVQKKMDLTRLELTIDRIDREYKAEVAKAEREHEMRQKDFTRQEGEEEARYAREIARIDREEAKKEATAARALAKRLEEIQHQKEAEDRRVAHETEMAEQKKQQDEDRARHQEEFESQMAERKLRREQDNAEKIADRQIAEAEKMYARQEEDNQRHAEREERDYEEKLANIATRESLQTEHLEQEQQRREDTYNQHLSRLEERLKNADDKLTDESRKIADDITASQKLASTEWTQDWIDNANKVQDHWAEVTGRTQTMHFVPLPDKDGSPERESERFKIATDQIQQWLLDVDRRAGVNLDDLRKMFFQFRSEGVDPVVQSFKEVDGSTTVLNQSLLETAATMSLLPQAAGRSTQIVRGLANVLRENYQLAWRELNTLGVNIYDTTATIDGVTRKLFDDQHHIASEFKGNTELVTRAILEHIQAQSENLEKSFIGTFRQIQTSLQTTWILLEQRMSPALFDNIKSALRDLSQWLDTNGEQVNAWADRLGALLGDISGRIITMLRSFGTDESLRAIGNLIQQVGHLKDVIVDVIHDIIETLFPGGVSITPADFFSGMAGGVTQLTQVISDNRQNITDFVVTVVKDIQSFFQWIYDHRQEILDTLKNIFDMFGTGTRFLLDHHDAVGKLLLAYLGLAALSSIVGTIGTVTTAVAGLARVIGMGGTGAAGGAAAAGSGLGTALSALGQVAGGVLGAIRNTASAIANLVLDIVESMGRLVAAVVTNGGLGSVREAFQTLRMFLVTEVGPAFQEFGRALLGSLGLIVTGVQNAFTLIGDAIYDTGPIGRRIVLIWEGIAGQIVAGWNSVRPRLVAVGEQVVSAITGALGQLPAKLNELSSTVVTAITTFGTTIRDTLARALSGLGGGINAAEGLLTRIFGNILVEGETIKANLITAIDNIVVAVQTELANFVSLFERTATQIANSQFAAAVREAFLAVGTAIRDSLAVVTALVNRIYEAIFNLGLRILNSGLGQRVSQAFSQASNAIQTGLGLMARAVADEAGHVVTGVLMIATQIRAQATQVGTAVESMVGAVVSQLRIGATLAAQQAAQFVHSFVTTMIREINGARQQVETAVNAIIGVFTRLATQIRAIDIGAAVQTMATQLRGALLLMQTSAQVMLNQIGGFFTTLRNTIMGTQLGVAAAVTMQQIQVALTTARGIIDIMLQQIGGFFSGLYTTLIRINYGSAVSTAMAPMSTAVTASSRQVAIAGTGLMGVFNSWINQAAIILRMVVSNIATILGPEVVAAIQRAAASWRLALAALMVPFNLLITQIRALPLVSAITTLMTLAYVAVNSWVGRIGVAVAALAIPFRSLMTQIAGMNIVSSLIGPITTFAGVLSGVLTTAARTATVSVSGLWAAITAPISVPIAIIIGLVVGLAAAFATNFLGIRTSTQNLITNLGSILPAGIRNIFENASGPIGEFVQFFRDKFDQLKIMLGFQTADVVKTVSDQFHELVPKISYVMNNLDRTTTDDLQTLIGNMRGQLSQMAGIGGTEAEHMRSEITYQVTQMQAVVDQRTKEAEKASTANLHAMNVEGSDEAAQLAGNVGNSMGQAATAGTAGANQLVQGVSGAMQQLNDTIAQIVANIQTIMANMMHNMQEAASGAQAAAAAAEQAASRAEAAASRAASASGRAGSTTPTRGAGTPVNVAGAAGGGSTGSGGGGGFSVSGPSIGHSTPTTSAPASGGGSSPAPAAPPAPAPTSVTPTGGFGGGSGGFSGGGDNLPPKTSNIGGLGSIPMPPSSISPTGGGDITSIYATPSLGSSGSGGGGGSFSSGATGGTTGSGSSQSYTLGGSEAANDMVAGLTGAAGDTLKGLYETVGAAATYLPSLVQSLSAPVTTIDMSAYAGSGIGAFSQGGSVADKAAQRYDQMMQQDTEARNQRAALDARNVQQIGQAVQTGFTQVADALMGSPAPSLPSSPAGPPTTADGGGAPDQPNTPQPQNPEPNEPQRPEEPPLPRDEPDRNITVQNQFDQFIVNGSSPEFVDQFVRHEIELFRAASVASGA